MEKINLSQKLIILAGVLLLLTGILLLGIVFSTIHVLHAAAPNPGHTWSEIGDVAVTADQIATGSGVVVLLYADETNSTEVQGPTTETTLKSWTLPDPLPYSRIIVEAEVRGRQEEDVNENPIYEWRFYEGSTLKKAVDWRLQSSSSGGTPPTNDSLRLSATIKTSWTSPTPGATVSLRVVWTAGTAADTGDYLMANSFRVYGVK